ncbi:MAG: hypothetical protein HZB09_00530 [Candidatus Yonathbacteria bacterium]|nr:hypothetical protein [Candidatus Yonathbacteria bacterium]
MRKISNIIILTLLIAILSPIFIAPNAVTAQTAPTSAQQTEITSAENTANGSGSSISYLYPLTDGTYYASDGLVYTADQLAKKTNETEFGITCWSLLPPKLDMGACVALVGYYMFWWPAAGVMALSGAIFDTSAAWSFNADILRGTASNPSMVAPAWAMVRDLANLSLIFALLYIAIATILQIGGVQLKKAVANVVIVALLINFSLFITEVVIDASNVLASSLYSKIIANAAPETGLGPNAIGSENTGVLQISTRITAAFNPQRLLTPELVKKWKEDNAFGLASLFWVFLFAGVVGFVAAYAFLKGALLLIARLVMFVFLIISSPLAFAAWALPGGGGGFDKKWWSTLVDQALVAPVFFLMLYVITAVYRNNIIDSILGTGIKEGMWAFLTNIALHFVIVIVALLMAIKITTKLSGAAGSYATKIGGAALLGGAAIAGRQTLGRAANSEFMKRQVAKLGDGAVGRTADRALGAVGSSTMDLRGIPGVEGMGKAGGKGGFKKSFDATQQRKEGFANRRMNAIDPKTGKSRGDTQVDAMEYATDEERMGHWKKQQAYDVAMVKHPEKMKAYEVATQKYQEDMMFYKKESAEGKTPVKPVEPNPPKAPEKPAGFTLSARERLARQHEKSWSSSSKAAADNIRKGKGGGKSKAEKLAEAAAEYEKERDELSGKITEKETEKPKET